ncbi:pyridine nucleotide-disulfide oxidoreductase [Devosia epidermidihirudinis]|uniref:Soluble pyridine nucleotide transhydrogenase n=1 Tax=Devosia epidermidihirudinis TaxID=1293439 RepID=A0A0F5QBZ2_9HYPH|nr:Si-specific NAD(P)(+) transhydrogenase [Devosia epidermidihirudinis]KKC38221.1 pyridine nucleotide-disulfide oxidoreductase [Devosia epidermidihirudinis]
MEQFDLVAIGSGPAGRRAAIQAAKLGRSVLVVENRLRLGGVSVHTGTIPSKTLRETVLNLSGWRERGFYGLAYRVKKDIEGKDLGARLLKTLDYEIEVLEHQFARNGVRTLGGVARFADANHLEVSTPDGETTRVGFLHSIIAVGTSPFRPANIPFNDHSVLDSDSLVTEPRVPRSLTVVGAGVIGLEYATIFSALDVPVTIIEPRDSYLDFIDREIIEEFTHDLRKRGVTIRLGAKVVSVELDEQGWAIAVLADGRRVRSDMLLYAAGRVGATADLGLDTCGVVADDRGRLKVDPLTFQTSVPNIYAAGDVIGFPSLASTSMEQGRIAALHACGAAMPKAPEFFPYGIYAVPEISTVGLTEQEVKAKGIPYECGVARFRETSRGHIMGLQSGMMKLIFSLENRKLLGAHIVGEGATELIHIGQAVLNLGGTLDYFVENAFNYPTLAEAYKIAALDAWNRMPRTTPVAPIA